MTDNKNTTISFLVAGTIGGIIGYIIKNYIDEKTPPSTETMLINILKEKVPYAILTDWTIPPTQLENVTDNNYNNSSTTGTIYRNGITNIVGKIVIDTGEIQDFLFGGRVSMWSPEIARTGDVQCMLRSSEDGVNWSSNYAPIAMRGVGTEEAAVTPLNSSIVHGRYIMLTFTPDSLNSSTVGNIYVKIHELVGYKINV